jgi:glucose-6-phosphate isomerase
MGGAHDLLSHWPALDVPSKRARLAGSLQVFDGPLMAAPAANADAERRAAGSLWRRDPSLWTGDESVQRLIANRLGWMTSPAKMADSIERLESFAQGVRRDGFTHVVLLGMGGSSLAPEVLRSVLGVNRGWPEFTMLDSTDPAAVLSVSTPPERTLYLLASKSGTTIEPNSLAAHFREQLKPRTPRWQDHFVAITDEDTALARRAREERFRDLFINPSDIGGRYSAISYFGLVPAALMGQDLDALVGWSLGLLSAAEPDADTDPTNVATALGALIGRAALQGRDKLTLILPAALEPLGLWVEQLIAESTGKSGTGVVPIAGEPLTSPAAYGTDRVFVRVRLADSATERADDAVAVALRSRAPFAEISVAEPAALGAEFLRWEIATAIAGAMLRVNPFDEPNVQQAKDATRQLLSRRTSTGGLRPASPETELAGVGTLSLTEAASKELRGRNAEAILTLLGKTDYFALLAYVGPDPEIARELRSLRVAVRDRAHVATMLGYGPRYLHSTGQLHKGGSNTGVFVLLTADPAEDLPIPGESFSFGTLELAQALGDFESLGAEGRRALYVHLPRQEARLVRAVAAAILQHLPLARGSRT